MTTDKTPATLATAKHGGCVQLATVPYDRARELIGDAYNAGTHGIGYSQQIMELHDAVFTAQPSPAGQVDAWAIKLARESAFAHSNEHAYLPQTRQETNRWQPHEWVVAAIQAAALGVPQPVGQITDAEIDACLNALYREMVDSGQHNGGMSGVAWNRAVYRTAASPPAQAVDPTDPWRGLYSPNLMPRLDGVNLYNVAHPDLPSWPKDEDEERGIGPLITAQGFAVEVVFGEYPDDDGEAVDYCAWLASWSPESPKGADWRLVCIQDTEDGPAAFFVRPLALIDSQAVGNG